MPNVSNLVKTIQNIMRKDAGTYGDALLDPACGTGGFLVCAIEHLRKQARTEAHERTIQDCFAGIESNYPAEFRTRETPTSSSCSS